MYPGENSSKLFALYHIMNAIVAPNSNMCDNLVQNSKVFYAISQIEDKIN